MIVSRHRAGLLAASRRILGEASAEDAVQIALLNAWRALRAGTEVGCLRPWLLAITRRCSIALIDRARVASCDVDLLAPCVSAADELELRTEARAALRAVSLLPPDEREALIRGSLQGQSGRESALALGVSETTVRQLVFRARKHLRDSLAAGRGALLPAFDWFPRGLSALASRVRRPVLLARVAGAPAQGTGSATSLAGRLALGVLAGAMVGVPVLHGTTEAPARRPSGGIANADFPPVTRGSSAGQNALTRESTSHRSHRTRARYRGVLARTQGPARQVVLQPPGDRASPTAADAPEPSASAPASVASDTGAVAPEADPDAGTSESNYAIPKPEQPVEPVVTNVAGPASNLLEAVKGQGEEAAGTLGAVGSKVAAPLLPLTQGSK